MQLDKAVQEMLLSSYTIVYGFSIIRKITWLEYRLLHV